MEEPDDDSAIKSTIIEELTNDDISSKLSRDIKNCIESSKVSTHSSPHENLENGIFKDKFNDSLSSRCHQSTNLIHGNHMATSYNLLNDLRNVDSVEETSSNNPLIRTEMLNESDLKGMDFKDGSNKADCLHENSLKNGEFSPCVDLVSTETCEDPLTGVEILQDKPVEKHTSCESKVANILEGDKNLKNESVCDLPDEIPCEKDSVESLKKIASKKSIENHDECKNFAVTERGDGINFEHQSPLEEEGISEKALDKPEDVDEDSFEKQDHSKISVCEEKSSVNVITETEVVEKGKSYCKNSLEIQESAENVEIETFDENLLQELQASENNTDETEIFDQNLTQDEEAPENLTNEAETVLEQEKEASENLIKEQEHTENMTNHAQIAGETLIPELKTSENLTNEAETVLAQEKEVSENLMKYQEYTENMSNQAQIAGETLIPELETSENLTNEAETVLAQENEASENLMKDQEYTENMSNQAQFAGETLMLELETSENLTNEAETVLAQEKGAYEDLINKQEHSENVIDNAQTSGEALSELEAPENLTNTETMLAQEQEAFENLIKEQEHSEIMTDPAQIAGENLLQELEVSKSVIDEAETDFVHEQKDSGNTADEVDDERLVKDQNNHYEDSLREEVSLQDILDETVTLKENYKITDSTSSESPKNVIFDGGVEDNFKASASNRTESSTSCGFDEESLQVIDDLALKNTSDSLPSCHREESEFSTKENLKVSSENKSSSSINDGCNQSQDSLDPPESVPIEEFSCENDSLQLDYKETNDCIIEDNFCSNIQAADFELQLDDQSHLREKVIENTDGEVEALSHISRDPSSRTLSSLGENVRDIEDVSIASNTAFEFENRYASASPEYADSIKSPYLSSEEDEEPRVVKKKLRKDSFIARNSKRKLTVTIINDNDLLLIEDIFSSKQKSNKIIEKEDPLAGKFKSILHPDKESFSKPSSPKHNPKKQELSLSKHKRNEIQNITKKSKPVVLLEKAYSEKLVTTKSPERSKASPLPTMSDASTSKGDKIQSGVALNNALESAFGDMEEFLDTPSIITNADFYNCLPNTHEEDSFREVNASSPILNKKKGKHLEKKRTKCLSPKLKNLKIVLDRSSISCKKSGSQNLTLQSEIKIEGVNNLSHESHANPEDPCSLPKICDIIPPEQPSDCVSSSNSEPNPSYQSSLEASIGESDKHPNDHYIVPSSSSPLIKGLQKGKHKLSSDVSSSQSLSERRMNKTNTLKNDVQNKCCGHWFPNKKQYLQHLIANSSGELDIVHQSKLLESGMLKCQHCEAWKTSSLLSKHMKMMHGITVPKASRKNSLSIKIKKYQSAAFNDFDNDEETNSYNSEDGEISDNFLSQNDLNFLNGELQAQMSLSDLALSKPCPKSKKLSYKMNISPKVDLNETFGVLPYSKPCPKSKKPSKYQRNVHESDNSKTFILSADLGPKFSKPCPKSRKLSHSRQITCHLENDPYIQTTIVLDSISQMPPHLLPRVELVSSPLITPALRSINCKKLGLLNNNDEELSIDDMLEYLSDVDPAWTPNLSDTQSEEDPVVAHDSDLFSDGTYGELMEALSGTLRNESTVIRKKKFKKLSKDKKSPSKRPLPLHEKNNNTDLLKSSDSFLFNQKTKQANLMGPKFHKHRKKSKYYNDDSYAPQVKLNLKGKRSKYKSSFVSKKISETSDGETSYFSESDDVEVDDQDDGAFTDSSQKENVPTVELDLFTLPTFDEEVSLLLRDSQNPDLKVFASMDAIFVGDSGSTEHTDHISYLVDSENVIFVNPGHFLFPKVEESQHALKKLSKGNKKPGSIREGKASVPIIKKKNKMPFSNKENQENMPTKPPLLKIKTNTLEKPENLTFTLDEKTSTIIQCKAQIPDKKLIKSKQQLLKKVNNIKSVKIIKKNTSDKLTASQQKRNLSDPKNTKIISGNSKVGKLQFLASKQERLSSIKKMSIISESNLKCVSRNLNSSRLSKSNEANDKIQPKVLHIDAADSENNTMVLNKLSNNDEKVGKGAFPRGKPKKITERSKSKRSNDKPIVIKFSTGISKRKRPANSRIKPFKTIKIKTMNKNSVDQSFIPKLEVLKSDNRGKNAKLLQNSKPKVSPQKRSNLQAHRNPEIIGQDVEGNVQSILKIANTDLIPENDNAALEVLNEMTNMDDPLESLLKTVGDDLLDSFEIFDEDLPPSKDNKTVSGSEVCAKKAEPSATILSLPSPKKKVSVLSKKTKDPFSPKKSNVVVASAEILPFEMLDGGICLEDLLDQDSNLIDFGSISGNAQVSPKKSIIAPQIEGTVIDQPKEIELASSIGCKKGNKTPKRRSSSGSILQSATSIGKQKKSTPQRKPEISEGTIKPRKGKQIDTPKAQRKSSSLIKQRTKQQNQSDQIDKKNSLQRRPSKVIGSQQKSSCESNELNEIPIKNNIPENNSSKTPQSISEQIELPQGKYSGKLAQYQKNSGAYFKNRRKSIKPVHPGKNISLGDESSSDSSSESSSDSEVDVLSNDNRNITKSYRSSPPGTDPNVTKGNTLWDTPLLFSPNGTLENRLQTDKMDDENLDLSSLPGFLSPKAVQYIPEVPTLSPNTISSILSPHSKTPKKNEKGLKSPNVKSPLATPPPNTVRRKSPKNLFKSTNRKHSNIPHYLNNPTRKSIIKKAQSSLGKNKRGRQRTLKVNKKGKTIQNKQVSSTNSPIKKNKAGIKVTNLKDKPTEPDSVRAQKIKNSPSNLDSESILPESDAKSKQKATKPLPSNDRTKSLKMKISLKNKSAIIPSLESKRKTGKVFSKQSRDESSSSDNESSTSESSTSSSSDDESFCPPPLSLNNYYSKAQSPNESNISPIKDKSDNKKEVDPSKSILSTPPKDLPVPTKDNSPVNINSSSSSIILASLTEGSRQAVSSPMQSPKNKTKVSPTTLTNPPSRLKIRALDDLVDHETSKSKDETVFSPVSSKVPLSSDEGQPHHSLPIQNKSADDSQLCSPRSVKNKSKANTKDIRTYFAPKAAASSNSEVLNLVTFDDLTDCENTEPPKEEEGLGYSSLSHSLIKDTSKRQRISSPAVSKSKRQSKKSNSDIRRFLSPENKRKSQFASNSPDKRHCSQALKSVVNSRRIHEQRCKQPIIPQEPLPSQSDFEGFEMDQPDPTSTKMAIRSRALTRIVYLYKMISKDKPVTDLPFDLLYDWDDSKLTESVFGNG